MHMHVVAPSILHTLWPLPLPGSSSRACALILITLARIVWPLSSGIVALYRFSSCTDASLLPLVLGSAGLLLGAVVV